jgi:hypothetical protein
MSKLDAFLGSSYSTYNSKKESAEEWSRAQARAFYHTLKTPVEFLGLYSHCLKYLETRATSQKKAPVAKKIPVEKKEGVFAQDGSCTDAEFTQGRSQMNVILNREYSLWWDAFVQEESEDSKKDALTADDRFALHCGKMLASKTGISLEMTASVVNAWLIEKHA